MAETAEVVMAGAVAANGTRAVVRVIDPGNTVDCAHCHGRVKFIAKRKGKQVIANVYVNGYWDRVEHFHADCYVEAGEPHGPVRP